MNNTRLVSGQSVYCVRRPTRGLRVIGTCGVVKEATVREGLLVFEEH